MNCKFHSYINIYDNVLTFVGTKTLETFSRSGLVSWYKLVVSNHFNNIFLIKKKQYRKS